MGLILRVLLGLPLLRRELFGLSITLPRGRTLHAEVEQPQGAHGGVFTHLPTLSWERWFCPWEGTSHDGTVSVTSSDEAPNDLERRLQRCFQTKGGGYRARGIHVVGCPPALLSEEDVMHRGEGQWEQPATAMPCPAKVQHNQKSPGPNSGMLGQIARVS